MNKSANSIEIDYRPMRDPAKETARFSHIIERAFGGGPPDRVPKWLERLGPANVRLAETSLPGMPAKQTHGTLSLIHMGQYFGGRSVPMIGIAGVAVSPEARGRGVATAMMECAVRESHAMGAPLSALYPATQPLYRRVGFEQAGSRFEHRIETSMVRVRERSLSTAPMGDAERAEARRLYARWAARCDGALDRGDYIWARIHQPLFQQADGYLFVGASGPEGYLVQAPMAAPTPGAERGELFFTDICALTPAAARAILTHMAEHDSRVGEAVFHGGPWHALTAMLDEQSFKTRLLEHWMIRIVDVPKALEARGYPPGLSLSLGLEVRDPLIPSNEGRFHMEVRDGRAHVTRGRTGGPALRLEIRDLAPLYAGFATPWALRLLGRLEGDDDSMASAAAMFAGSASAMADMF